MSNTRLINFRLIASTDFTAANQLISDQRSNLIALGQQGSDAEHVAQIATTYLDYLTNTWMSEPLWQSWSQYGRIVASQLLNVAGPRLVQHILQRWLLMVRIHRRLRAH
jgi:hypothetical protein